MTSCISIAILMAMTTLLSLAKGSFIVHIGLEKLAYDQVLMELPRVNEAVIEAFNQQLLSTNSEKEQRAAIKTLLSNSGLLRDWNIGQTFCLPASFC